MANINGARKTTLNIDMIDEVIPLANSENSNEKLEVSKHGRRASEDFYGVHVT